jgi:hypothetical protein
MPHRAKALMFLCLLLSVAPACTELLNGQRKRRRRRQTGSVRCFPQTPTHGAASRPGAARRNEQLDFEGRA